MRHMLLGTVAVLALTSASFAEEQPYSQTLDEQLARVQQGEQPVPVVESTRAVAAAAESTTVAPASRKSFNDWPPSAAAAPATPATAAPVSPSVARNGEIIESRGAGAIPSLPLTIYEANGIKYVTGGVGDEEVAQLKSVDRDFNTQILLTANQGEYLSSAMIRVLDSQGSELLAVDGAGPYFYTNLKPGSYTIEVTDPQGGLKSTKVRVPTVGAVREQMRFTVVG